MSRLMRECAILAVLAISISCPAAAQNWPSRSITLVTPFTAGSTVDGIARGFGEFVAEKVGQPVVVENRAGAGGNLGASSVVKAAPDGYTILLSTTGPASLAKLMYKNLGYDPQKDLAPISLVAKAPVIIVARPGLPVNNLSGLIAHLKANPGKLTAGYVGNGTLGHITGELLQATTGTRMAAVQHRGTAALITDLLGEHLDVGMDSIAPYVALVRDGKLKALAHGGAKRWPRLPDVPTVAEAGIPGFEANVWYALLAPAGTPGDIITRLNSLSNDYLKHPKTISQFENLAVVAEGSTPEQLRAFVQSELDRWGPVIKAANISF